MVDSQKPGVCPSCGTVGKRLISRTTTDLKEFYKPIEMQSVAANSMAEIREYQRAGVTISDDPNSETFGIPIAANRKEKLKILSIAGFVETR
jgi:hypothetical protein